MSTPLPADLREALATPQFTEAALDEACAVLDDVRTAVLQWAAARYRALPVAWQDRPPEKSPLRHLEEAEAVRCGWRRRRRSVLRRRRQGGAGGRRRPSRSDVSDVRAAHMPRGGAAYGYARGGFWRLARPHQAPRRLPYTD